MSKIQYFVSVVTLMCGILCGCKSKAPSIPHVSVAQSTNTYVVVVGMENSQFAGRCSGAGYDADRMYKLLSQYTQHSILLRDSNATKANVVKALKEAIAKAGDGLVIFFYSGHGGSEAWQDTGIEEVDGKDEFYCLWDTWLRDNDMWNIINESKGRIMLINDCCHSETIFRSPSISLRNSMPLCMSRRFLGFSMLCWSGCPDNTYSYGSVSGGQFTNSLLRHFDAAKTYETLWNEIKNDSVLQMYENPQSTMIGDSFVGKPIFQ